MVASAADPEHRGDTGTGVASQPPPRAVLPSHHLSDTEFAAILSPRAGNMFRASRYLALHRQNCALLTRPLLACVHSDAEQLEELLDAYGARTNSRWFAFRELVAAVKTFTQVARTLVHLEHAFSRYNLRAPEGSRRFLPQTQRAIDYIRRVLTHALSKLARKGETLGLTPPADAAVAPNYQEVLPAGVLPEDRSSRHVSSADEVVVHLTTEYLELAAKAEFVHLPDTTDAEDYRAYIPDPISEETLRQLEHGFHNLQSMYDTFISDTDIEELDEKLPQLRSHASLVFHLLNVATDLVHFYERHILLSPQDFCIEQECSLDSRRLLPLIMEYGLAYSSLYIRNGRQLCQSMLKRYAEVTTVDVPVPPYRGFHVRPATLIAKIVQHYGTQVTMHYDHQTYDARTPLDLFRANEAINAKKRHAIGEKIARLQLPDTVQSEAECRQIIRRAVLAMAERNDLVIYEHPLPINDIAADREQSVHEIVAAEVKRLLMLGKIDMDVEQDVRFRGDKRVLDDIRRLADAGYGEDRFGNNIPLPAELTYLRRQRE